MSTFARPMSDPLLISDPGWLTIHRILFNIKDTNVYLAVRQHTPINIKDTNVYLAVRQHTPILGHHEPCDHYPSVSCCTPSCCQQSYQEDTATKTTLACWYLKYAQQYPADKEHVYVRLVSSSAPPDEEAAACISRSLVV